MTRAVMSLAISFAVLLFVAPFVAGEEGDPEKTAEEIGIEKRDMADTLKGLREARDYVERRKAELEDDLADRQADLAAAEARRDAAEVGSDAWAQAVGDIQLADHHIALLKDEIESFEKRIDMVSEAISDAEVELREHCEKWGDGTEAPDAIDYEGEKADFDRGLRNARLARQKYQEYVAGRRAVMETAKAAWEALRGQYPGETEDDPLAGIPDDMKAQAKELLDKYKRALERLDAAEWANNHLIELEEWWERQLRLHCEQQAGEGD